MRPAIWHAPDARRPTILVLLGLLVALATGAMATAGGAQPAPSAHDAPVTQLDVIGLHRWTVRMLRDSLARRVPGGTLESAACQVLLRDSLHFADALVHNLIVQDQPDAPPRRYLTIKLVEPQDRARVRWAPAPPDSFTALRPAYAPVVLAVTDSDGTFWVGRLEDPLQFTNLDAGTREQALASTIAEFPPAAQDRVRDDAHRLWAFLDAHRTEGDHQAALTTLRRDGFYVNRVMAAIVLANFPDQDATWWALVDALRDSHEAVRSTALLVLTRFAGRPVDWQAAVPTLRRL